MKNRGFTLVELIAVIVILGIISLLAVAAVSRMIRDSREKTYGANVDTILNAAYDYAQRNMSVLPNEVNGDKKVDAIKLTDLKDAGYLKDEMYNTMNRNLPFSDGCTITIEYRASFDGEHEELSLKQKFFGKYLFTFNDVDVP